MLHRDLIPEIGCDGELIQVDERSTKDVTVARCSICGTDSTYVPDSDWVTIVSPGMRNPLNRRKWVS